MKMISIPYVHKAVSVLYALGIFFVTAAVPAHVSAWDISTASYSGKSFPVGAGETTPTDVAFSADGMKMFVLGSGTSEISSYTLGEPFDFSTSTLHSKFFVGTQDFSPQGVAFNTDGTKMFVVGAGSDSVYEYTLGTAFNVSTATYVDSFSVAAQDTFPMGVAFNTDGTKMYVLGDTGNDVNEYTLTTGFDVSTATYVDNLIIGLQESAVTGMSFSADGTKIFVVGTTGDTVHEYRLGTAFDASTATYAGNSSVVNQEVTPQGITFSADGTKMFVIGSTGDDVNEYDLSSAFTVVNDTEYVSSFSVVGQDSNPGGLAFSADGMKMFMTGFSSKKVNEFTLGTAFDVSTATFVDGFSVADQDTNPKGITFNTDGTKMFVLGGSGVDVNEYSLGTGFDVSTASFVDSFSVSGQETAPGDIAFSADGTKMFVIGSTGDDVNEYTLGTAFDVSTASFVDSFSVAAQDTGPSIVDFSADGMKMFIIGTAGADVNEYTLGTAFDVSTATFVDALAFNGEETSPSDVTFNTDGTKMFVIGTAGDDVNEYTLSTGFDVTTARFVDSFSIAAQETSPSGVEFSADGTKMFVIGTAGDDVNEYTLGTAFDVSTASFVDTFSVAAQDLNPVGLAFSSDGMKMFVVGQTGVDINEYTLGTAFDVSTGTFVDSFSVSAQETSLHDVAFSADGTKMYVLGLSGDDVNEYILGTAFDVSTASFLGSFRIGDQENAPNGLAFNSDGTKMYVIGTTADNVFEYALSVGFSIVGDVDYVTSFSVSNGGQDTFPSGVAFNADGTKMFVSGAGGDNVYEYTLGTAFDVSTVSFVESFSVAGEDITPQDLSFNTDGTKMFILGASGLDVNEYALSTGFDVSTASFVDSFSVAGQETTLTGMAFSTDGTKMFVIGSAGDDVNEYSLGTAFDVSTATFVDSFSIAAEESLPGDVAFSADGTKMYVTGSTGDDVNEYTLGTAFDVSTASFVQTFSVAGQETSPQSLVFNINGGKMYVTGFDRNTVFQYTLVLPDTTDPVITILGDNPAEHTAGETYTDAGATASDDTDGDITADIQITNSVDANTPGTYTVVYEVEDAAGNTDTATRTVEVIAAPEEDESRGRSSSHRKYVTPAATLPPQARPVAQLTLDQLKQEVVKLMQELVQILLAELEKQTQNPQ